MHCALLHSMYDLKAVQMNLIWELLLDKFELGHNTAEAPKNICCVKGEGAIDHISVTRWFKKFYLGCKDLDDQAMSGRPKTMEFKAMLKAVEANPTSNTPRVSRKLRISQSSMINQLHDLSKSIWSCWIVPHIIKILQNFWLTFV